MKRVFLLFTLILISLPSWPQNENISEGQVFDGEPYLAVNPADPDHMVVAWMGFIPFEKLVIKSRVTFDGGESWSNVNYIPHQQPSFSSADPSLAFDNNGNVYSCYIDFDRAIDSGAVYVSKSTDGGLTWNTPVKVIDMHDDPGQLPIDRPWMVIDKSGGPFDDRIYVTTMNAKGATAPFHPYFLRSTDGGSSFEPWEYLDTTGWLSGPFIPQPMPTPAVGADGTFHAVYPSYVIAQSIYPRFLLASSADGGASFDYTEVFSSTNSLDDTLAKKGPKLIANPSDADHLVFIYLSTKHGDADVFIRESFDKGTTWTDGIRVNDDPIGNNRMQDLVWGDFDEDGDLVISWRDRRNGSDSTYRTASEIYAAYRDEDSTQFADNFQLSDAQVDYDTILSKAGNDFMCIQLVNDTLNAVWGDTRSGKLNIWFQQLATDGTVLSTSQIAGENRMNINIYPNPTGDHLNFDMREETTGAQVKIYSMDGILKKQFILHDTKRMNLATFEAGTYIYTITQGESRQTGKFVVQ